MTSKLQFTPTLDPCQSYGLLDLKYFLVIKLHKGYKNSTARDLVTDHGPPMYYYLLSPKIGHRNQYSPCRQKFMATPPKSWCHGATAHPAAQQVSKSQLIWDCENSFFYLWYRRFIEFMTKNPKFRQNNKQTNPENQKRKIKHWLALSFSKDQTDIGKQAKTAVYEPCHIVCSCNGEKKLDKGKDDANNSNHMSHFLKTL